MISSCLECSANQTGVYCTLCAANYQLVGAACAPCSATTYYNATSKVCVLCSSVLSNCNTCSAGGAACLSCTSASQTELAAGQCVPCNSSSYFNPPDQKCYACSGAVPNCTQCQLVSGPAVQCQQCASSSYLNASDSLCRTCSSAIANCEQCSPLGGGQCTACKAGTQTVLVSYTCQPCTGSTYYDPALSACGSCPSGCLACTNSSNCTSCTSSAYTLILDTCILISTEYDFQVSTNDQNQIVITLNFDSTSTTLILNLYTLEIFIDSSPATFTSYSTNNNQSLVVTVPMDKSLTTPVLHIVFVNKSAFYTPDINNSTYQMDSVSYIGDQESDFYSALDRVLSAVNMNMGAGYTLTSMTETTIYFVSLIWTIDIVSMYIFLPVRKPRNLATFLNITNKMGGVSLLPFAIPNPLGDDATEIASADIYDQEDVDLFFARNYADTAFEVAVFVVGYSLLYLLTRSLKSSNCVASYLKLRFAKRFLSNIIILLLSVITSLCFSASATLSSRCFAGTVQGANYLSSLLGLLCGVGFVVISCEMLAAQKKNRKIDSEDAYFGGRRYFRYSEACLLMYGLMNVLVCVCIPSFHPVLALLVIIVSVVTNVVCLARFMPQKVKACSVMRCLNHCCFLLFNLVFVTLYLIEHMGLKVEVSAEEIFGFTGIGCVLAMMSLDTLEAAVDMLNDLQGFVTRKCRKASTQNRKGH